LYLKKKDHKLHDISYYKNRVDTCLKNIISFIHIDKYINQTLIEYYLKNQLPNLNINEVFAQASLLQGSNLQLNLLMLKIKK